MSAPDELWINPADLENIEQSIMVFTEPDKARADVRYIRAPDSAPKLADKFANALATYRHNLDGRQLANLCCVYSAEIESALRNQPGGAVPREPTEAMVQAACDISNEWRFFIDRLPDYWRAMYDAATKAGEGET